MDINLLPWRKIQHSRRLKQTFMVVILLILLFCLMIVYIEYQTKQRMQAEALKNQQLQARIQQLKLSYRKQLYKKQQQMHHELIKKDIDESDFPLKTALIQLNYAKATDLSLLLKDKINPMISDRGSVTADPRTNVIWIEETHEQITKVKAFIKQLDIPNRQVLIEARIVNMSKECARDLGVRFGLLRAVDPIQTTTFQSRESGNQTGERLNIDLGALPLDASPASIGIALASLERHVLLDLELSALESEGRAKIIASPRLMTTNQEPAIIESGEDIPYQEYTASGATSVSFKKAVLSLKVVPQITADGKLMMALSINQDSDSGRRVQGVPVILTKSIATNVLVQNGQTIVLGGIDKQDKNHHRASVPFLGTLPVVGPLFRRQQVGMRHEALIIFITPRIIKDL